MLLSTWHGVNFGLGWGPQGWPRPSLLIWTGLKSIPNELFSFCRIDYRPLNTKKTRLRSALSLLLATFKMQSSVLLSGSVFVSAAHSAAIAKLFLSNEQVWKGLGFKVNSLHIYYLISLSCTFLKSGWNIFIIHDFKNFKPLQSLFKTESQSLHLNPHESCLKIQHFTSFLSLWVWTVLNFLKQFHIDGSNNDDISTTKAYFGSNYLFFCSWKRRFVLNIKLIEEEFHGTTFHPYFVRTVYQAGQLNSRPFDE